MAFDIYRKLVSPHISSKEETDSQCTLTYTRPHNWQEDDKMVANYR